MEWFVLVTVLMAALAACEGLRDDDDDKSHHRRSFLYKNAKPMYCLGAPGVPGPPGPPGTSGSQGVPGRDGRDGRDCPPCNCAGSTSLPPPPIEPIATVEVPCQTTDTTQAHVPHHSCNHHHHQPPVDVPCNGLGSKHHPALSCDSIIKADPYATSGTYWLSSAPTYKTYCEMIKSHCSNQYAGGWTLVARAAGLSPDFAPTSPTWYDERVINPHSAADLHNPSSMKNAGWFSVPSNVIKVCFSGPNSNCATFTHNKGVTLSTLFATMFAVQTTEAFTFERLMLAFGKHLDLGHLKTEWCGLNLGNICDLEANPNTNPGTHIVRIGCIGDTSVPRSTEGCNPDDYAIGIGVSSCNNAHGCHHNTYGITKSLHFSSYKNHFGDYAQTAYIYVR